MIDLSKFASWLLAKQASKQQLLPQSFVIIRFGKAYKVSIVETRVRSAAASAPRTTAQIGLPAPIGDETDAQVYRIRAVD